MAGEGLRREARLIPFRPDRSKSNSSLWTCFRSHVDVLSNKLSKHADASPCENALLTVFVDPGQLGIHFQPETGMILQIEPGGQCAQAGVGAGWRIHLVNGCSYTDEVLRSHIAGQHQYSIAFATPTTIRKAEQEMLSQRLADALEPGSCVILHSLGRHALLNDNKAVVLRRDGKRWNVRLIGGRTYEVALKNLSFDSGETNAGYSSDDLPRLDSSGTATRARLHSLRDAACLNDNIVEVVARQDSSCKCRMIGGREYSLKLDNLVLFEVQGSQISHHSGEARRSRGSTPPVNLQQNQLTLPAQPGVEHRSEPGRATQQKSREKSRRRKPANTKQESERRRKPPPTTEATTREIEEYARLIGINSGEQDLLWIAREGLRAPVPSSWTASRHGDRIYYTNLETKEWTWDHPCDKIYRNMVQEWRSLRKVPREESPQGEPFRRVSSGSRGAAARRRLFLEGFLARVDGALQRHKRECLSVWQGNVSKVTIAAARKLELETSSHGPSSIGSKLVDQVPSPSSTPVATNHEPAYEADVPVQQQSGNTTGPGEMAIGPVATSHEVPTQPSLGASGKDGKDIEETAVNPSTPATSSAIPAKTGHDLARSEDPLPQQCPGSAASGTESALEGPERASSLPPRHADVANNKGSEDKAAAACSSSPVAHREVPVTQTPELVKSEDTPLPGASSNKACGSQTSTEEALNKSQPIQPRKSRGASSKEKKKNREIAAAAPSPVTPNSSPAPANQELARIEASLQQQQHPGDRAARKRLLLEGLLARADRVLHKGSLRDSVNTWKGYVEAERSNEMLMEELERTRMASLRKQFQRLGGALDMVAEADPLRVFCEEVTRRELLLEGILARLDGTLQRCKLRRSMVAWRGFIEEPITKSAATQPALPSHEELQTTESTILPESKPEEAAQSGGPCVFGSSTTPFSTLASTLAISCCPASPQPQHAAGEEMNQNITPPAPKAQTWPASMPPPPPAPAKEFPERVRELQNWLVQCAANAQVEVQTEEGCTTTSIDAIASVPLESLCDLPLHPTEQIQAPLIRSSRVSTGAAEPAGQGPPTQLPAPSVATSEQAAEAPCQHAVPEEPFQDPVPEAPLQHVVPEEPFQDPVPEAPLQHVDPEEPFQDPVPEAPLQHAVNPQQVLSLSAELALAMQSGQQTPEEPTGLLVAQDPMVQQPLSQHAVPEAPSQHASNHQQMLSAEPLPAAATNQPTSEETAMNAEPFSAMVANQQTAEETPMSTEPLPVTGSNQQTAEESPICGFHESELSSTPAQRHDTVDAKADPRNDCAQASAHRDAVALAAEVPVSGSPSSTLRPLAELASASADRCVLQPSKYAALGKWCTLLGSRLDPSTGKQLTKGFEQWRLNASAQARQQFVHDRVVRALRILENTTSQWEARAALWKLRSKAAAHLRPQARRNRERPWSAHPRARTPAVLEGYKFHQTSSVDEGVELWFEEEQPIFPNPAVPMAASVVTASDDEAEAGETRTVQFDTTSLKQPKVVKADSAVAPTQEVLAVPSTRPVVPPVRLEALRHAPSATNSTAGTKPSVACGGKPKVGSLAGGAARGRPKSAGAVLARGAQGGVTSATGTRQLTTTEHDDPKEATAVPKKLQRPGSSPAFHGQGQKEGSRRTTAIRPVSGGALRPLTAARKTSKADQAGQNQHHENGAERLLLVATAEVGQLWPEMSPSAWGHNHVSPLVRAADGFQVSCKSGHVVYPLRRGSTREQLIAEVRRLAKASINGRSAQKQSG